MRSFRLFTIATGALLAAASGAGLRAQQALYVSDGQSALRLVRKIEEGVPFVLERGKLAPLTLDSGSRASSYHFVLKPAEEFYPVFVTVREPKISFPSFSSQGLHRTDQRFLFSGTFASDYSLKNVFLAFEFDLADGQKDPQGVSVKGLASYELAEARPITTQMSFPDEAPRKSATLHVFSDGLEIFHSEMPRPFIEEHLAKMTAKRIEKVTDAPPKPIAGPMPRYPEKLQKTKNPGHAVVSCEIAPSGQPINSVVKSASDPAFGEAALAVIPQWWFLPKVENGHPVASKVELPFDFAPPKS